MENLDRSCVYRPHGDLGQDLPLATTFTEHIHCLLDHAVEAPLANTKWKAKGGQKSL